MIRYVYIGDQIIEDYDDFAFFDTITDTFLSFDGDQVFSSVAEFENATIDSKLLKRCLLLIPQERIRRG